MYIKLKHLGPLVMWNCQNLWNWQWPFFRTVTSHTSDAVENEFIIKSYEDLPTICHRLIRHVFAWVCVSLWKVHEVKCKISSSIWKVTLQANRFSLIWSFPSWHRSVCPSRPPLSCYRKLQILILFCTIAKYWISTIEPLKGVLLASTRLL